MAVTYAGAGVDIEAGDAAVELMKQSVAASHGNTVVAGAGAFAGMVDASVLLKYRHPLLATSTDGVGTKIAIAQALDIHDTIGQDLVGMVVDDIAVVGARPLLMTDYIACGHVKPARIADIVRGIAQACAAVECPLVGGETAEHPGLMGADDYDIAGAATGVVEADEMLGAQRVKVGDVLIGLAASGLHSNGYSLVRAIIADQGWDLERPVPEFGRTLGEELLEPTRLYSRMCLQMAKETEVHAFSHITGGGLGANLARVLPAGTVGVADRGAWPVPPVFTLLGAAGQVPGDDLEQTLNMGVGMVVAAPASSTDAIRRVAKAAGCDIFVLGSVRADDAAELPEGRRISGTKGVDGGAALLTGEYRSA